MVGYVPNSFRLESSGTVQDAGPHTTPIGYKERRRASDVDSDDSRTGSACAQDKGAFFRTAVNTWSRGCGVSVGREDCEKNERGAESSSVLQVNAREQHHRCQRHSTNAS